MEIRSEKHESTRKKKTELTNNILKNGTPDAIQKGLAGVSSLEGSVGNVVSAVVVTLQKTCESPGNFAVGERTSWPCRLTRTSARGWLFLLKRSYRSLRIHGGQRWGARHRTQIGTINKVDDRSIWDWAQIRHKKIERKVQGMGVVWREGMG